MAYMINTLLCSQKMRSGKSSSFNSIQPASDGASVNKYIFFHRQEIKNVLLFFSIITKIVKQFVGFEI